MTEKTDTTEAFDLSSFLAGCTSETRFVDVYQDRRLLAEARRAFVAWQRAVKDEEAGLSRPGRGIADVSDADALKARYLELKKKAEATIMTVEVAAVDRAIRQEITNTFKADNDISDEDLLESVRKQEGPAVELDYVTLAHAIKSPRLESAEAAKKFAAAIGDQQWGSITDAFAQACLSRLSLEDLEADFLPESSDEDDTDG